MAMPSSATLELFSQHVVANYGRAPISIVRGQGSRVWDAEGRCYLDLLPGLGVSGLGHCPPKVVAAIQKQAAEILHIHNNYLIEPQAKLAERIVSKITGMGRAKVFFCNSGTEATECAIKLARLCGQEHGRWKIISTVRGFHGRTYGALSSTGQPKFHEGVGPLLPGFSFVPLNDLAALESAFDAETVAFQVEPIQGEGGINPCSLEYLQAARALCDKHQALLMYDEVQCGMGRSGDYFGYQTLKAPAPDVLWLAKALGGGFPIGAVVAKDGPAAALKPGTHGSTYGGNHLACAASLAVFDSIDEEGLLVHVRETGQHLGHLLQDLASAFPKKITEIRRMGLMVAIELTFPGAPVVAACRDEGLLVNVTQGNVLRLLPALTVTKGELDEGLAIIHKVLAAHEA
jgi:acetylornithine/N-succinyldiaminopimelate aminotransferase